MQPQELVCYAQREAKLLRATCARRGLLVYRVRVFLRERFASAAISTLRVVRLDTDERELDAAADEPIEHGTEGAKRHPPAIGPNIGCKPANGCCGDESGGAQKGSAG